MWVSEGGGRPPGRHRARASGLTAFLGPRFSRLYPLYFFMLALDVFLGKTLFLSLLGKEDGFHDLARAALLPSIAAKLALCAVRELLTRLCDRRRRELVDQHRMVFLSRLPAAFGPGAQDTAAADHDLRTPGLVRVLGRAFLQPRGQAAIDACGVSHYGSVAGVAWGYQDSFYRWLLYLSPYSRVGEFVRVGCLVAQFYLVLRDIPPTGA